MVVVRDRFGVALWVAIALCLLWAAVAARGIRRSPAAFSGAVDAGAVEASFHGVQEARRAGRLEEALLGLRQRSERGPNPGFAWFLLGELAWEARAFGDAVRHYRRAIDLEAAVADRSAPFSSGRILDERLGALAREPWARGKPPELADFYYLRRRIAGGCE